MFSSQYSQPKLTDADWIYGHVVQGCVTTAPFGNCIIGLNTLGDGPPYFEPSEFNQSLGLVQTSWNAPNVKCAK